MIKRLLNLFLLMMLVSVMPVMAQTYDTVVDDENSDTPDTMSVEIDSVAMSLPWPQNIQAKLDKLMKNEMCVTSQVGMEIYDLTADSVLYKVNDRMLLRPASTMQLITAIAAIDKLGGSYQFRTSLYYTGQIENNTLNGDVYCVGGFDPRDRKSTRLNSSHQII